MSFYITALKIRKEVVDDINDKDEAVYETDIEEVIEKYLKCVQETDQEIYEKVLELLDVEDNEVKTFHMDLLSNV
jgi:hypothetical protein